jgi:molybdenum cofactor cytidylyltransferase
MSAQSEKLTCVILAAGASRRFGSAKMRHRLANGNTLLEETVKLYGTLFAEPVVVIREGDDELAELLRSLPVKPVISERSHFGMSESLKAGLVASADSDAWLFVLADMPYIKKETIVELQNAARTDKIIVPKFHGRPGNPVLFGKEFKDELLALPRGDQGAKQVVAANSAKVISLETHDEGLVLDIDYPSSIIEPS